MASLAQHLTASAPRPAAGFRHAAGELPVLRSIFVEQPTEAFDANEVLFAEGDPARHVFQVAEGVVRVYRLMPDGRRAITGFLFPGDLLGISLGELHLYTAEAITTVKVRRYLRSRFQGLMNDTPAFSRQVFAMICDELSAAQDQMMLLARKTAQERVASFLLNVARKLGRPGRPDEMMLPITRQDMADHLGLTIETVSRTMTKLKRDGAISLPDPHRVVIRNRALVQELAGDAEAPADPKPSSVEIRQRAVWPN